MTEGDNEPDRGNGEDWPLSTQILAAIAFFLFFLLLVVIEAPVYAALYGM